MPKYGNTKQKGFTLVELLVVTAIIAILAALAIPSFRSALLKQQLVTAVEQYVSHLSFAQSESTKINATVYVSISPGQTWCYGLSNVSTCSCGTANQCLLSGVDTTFNNTNLSDVSTSTSGFTTSDGNQFVSFEPVRGTANHTGTVTFTAGSNSVSVSTNALGLIQVCSNQLEAYTSC